MHGAEAFFSREGPEITVFSSWKAAIFLLCFPVTFPENRILELIADYSIVIIQVIYGN